jgi:hypothetical protein
LKNILYLRPATVGLAFVALMLACKQAQAGSLHPPQSIDVACQKWTPFIAIMQQSQDGNRTDPARIEVHTFIRLPFPGTVIIVVMKKGTEAEAAGQP